MASLKIILQNITPAGSLISTVITDGVTIQGDGSSSSPIALKNTAVTPGAYTNANITVDQQGRIIAVASGSSSGVTSVSGTSNRITSTGGATPVIDIAATYIGQTSITTVGTLIAGATSTGFTIDLANSTVSGRLPGPNSPLTSINTQTVSYQLVLTDADNKAIEMNVAGANNVTVPRNVTAAIPIGSFIPVPSYGVGTTTIVPEDGTVVVRSSSGTLTSTGQYSAMFLFKRAANEWYLWNGSAPYTASNGITLTTTNFTWGGALTADTALTGAFNLTFSHKRFGLTSTYTALANNDYGINYIGTITARGTVSDTLNGVLINPTLVSSAATQILQAVLVNPTFTDSNSATQYIQRWQNAGTDRLTMQSVGTLTHTVNTATLGAATRINVFTTNSGTSGVFNPVGYQFKTLNTVVSGSAPSLVWSAMFSHQAANGNAGFAWDGSSTNYLFLYNSSATNGFAGPDIHATATALTINGVNTTTIQLGTSSTGTQLALPGGSAATSGAYTHSSWTGTWSSSAAGSVTTKMMSITPTINYSGSVTAPVFYGAIFYSPTETSLTNTSHYFVASGSATAMSGFGTLTPTAMVHIAASSTVRASLCMAHGAAPTTPVNGDMWTTTAGLFVQINGVTKTVTLT